MAVGLQRIGPGGENQRMQNKLKAFRKAQFEKPPEKCPACGKVLKYETNIPKMLIADEMRKEHGINIKRHNIASQAECCDIGWVKLKTGY